MRELALPPSRAYRPNRRLTRACQRRHSAGQQCLTTPQKAWPFPRFDKPELHAQGRGSSRGAMKTTLAHVDDNGDSTYDRTYRYVYDGEDIVLK
jgi:hypothetical protein